ncbi:MAG: GNAT family N-acetyltransferase [Planctomycetota bacterium]|nr:GNAT family N-acetyltransferase [Planctomycetota bacterium]
MDGLRTTEQRGSREASQHATVQSPNVARKHKLVDLKQAGATRQAEARGGVTVAIARSLKEIEPLREVWRDLQSQERSPKPNADIDRYISVIKGSSGAVTPHVMLFKQGNRPVAMVVSRAENHQLSLKLGYKALLRPRLKCLHVAYGGVLGRLQGDLHSVILSELSRQLKSREFDMVCFNYLDTDTALYEAVRKTPGFFTRGYFPTVSKHWRMSVPGKMDQFYEACSRGHRSGLRRIIRKFEQEYPGRGNFVKYTSEDEVNDFLEVAAGISPKTYQHALGAGIVNDEQTISRIRTAARQGWFDGNVLFAGEKPCAFQLGLRYHGVYYLVKMGYDPAFNSYQIGTVLFLKALESLCEDPSIHTLDFYFGDAEYKRRYGTTHWFEACIYIFAPGMYPVSVNALRCAVAGTNATLAHIANKVGSTDWIKRKWRNLLNGGA